MEILDCVLDYQEKFDGKTCQVFTNYKLLETFKVEFHLTDLHHLFGLHKITRDFASKTIPAILSGVFVLETYRQHPKKELNGCNIQRKYWFFIGLIVI